MDNRPEELSLQHLQANWHWKALQNDLAERKDIAFKQLLRANPIEDPHSVIEAQEQYKLLDELTDPDYLKKLRDNSRTKEDEDGN